MVLRSRFLLACLLLLPGFVSAQVDVSKAGQPPQYLQIIAGRMSSRLDKAAGRGRHQASSWTDRSIEVGPDQFYLGTSAVAGPSEMLWLVFHKNLRDFEKQARVDATTLGSMGQRDSEQSAELVSNNRMMLARRRDDLSYRPIFNFGEYRYIAVHTFHSKLAHTRDVMEVLKILNGAREKSGSEVHIVVYEVMSGDTEGTLVSIVPRKSLAEMEQGDQRMQQAVGEDGWRRIRELADAGGFTLDNTLFAFEPANSNVSPEMVAANPDFWNTRSKVGKRITPRSPSNVKSQNP